MIKNNQMYTINDYLSISYCCFKSLFNNLYNFDFLLGYVLGYDYFDPFNHNYFSNDSFFPPIIFTIKIYLTSIL